MSEFEKFRGQFGDHWCLAQEPGVDDPFRRVCTLPPDHDGEHVAAHVGSGEVFARWTAA